jgi:hypothetical protein
MRHLALLLSLLAVATAHAQTVARPHTAELAAQASGIGSEAWWAVPDQAGVQQVNLECGKDYMDPREVVVRRGAPVQLNVRSGRDAEDQDFIVMDQRTRIGRSPTVLRFTPSSQGQSALTCSKPSDGARERSGKSGKLHVVSP